MGKNKLKNTTIYLSGPIDRCPNLGAEWREWITPKLHKYGINIYNPLKKPLDMSEEIEGREKRLEWKRTKNYHDLAKWMRYIRHVDLRMCDKSDAGIVYFDTSIFSCGTLEELFSLNYCKKPVLLMCKQGLDEVPDWIWGTIPMETIFDTWDELFEYLDKIDDGWDDGTGRWLVFDY